ncbi:hypothetical protein PVAP13_2NG177603 [Panicum virgatum]|uniref:Uncharacterized protein n=1 Tax=Panicum virgatum TaxID=38727 RepID=A0A8T0VH80_PANVG|nr:hypothetical protein PVAP13_2NG177603 [Panicum virgatum]
MNGQLVFYLLMKLLSKRKHSKLIIMQELTSQDILVPTHLCMRFLLTMKITMTTTRTSMSLGTQPKMGSQCLTAGCPKGWAQLKLL